MPHLFHKPLAERFTRRHSGEPDELHRDRRPRRCTALPAPHPHSTRSDDHFPRRSLHQLEVTTLDTARTRAPHLPPRSLADSAATSFREAGTTAAEVALSTSRDERSGDPASRASTAGARPRAGRWTAAHASAPPWATEPHHDRPPRTDSGSRRPARRNRGRHKRHVHLNARSAPFPRFDCVGPLPLDDSRCVG
jgi:hypothetical protein